MSDLLLRAIEASMRSILEDPAICWACTPVDAYGWPTDDRHVTHRGRCRVLGCECGA